MNSTTARLRISGIEEATSTMGSEFDRDANEIADNFTAKLVELGQNNDTIEIVVDRAVKIDGRWEEDQMRYIFKMPENGKQGWEFQGVLVSWLQSAHTMILNTRRS